MWFLSPPDGASMCSWLQVNSCSVITYWQYPKCVSDVLGNLPFNKIKRYTITIHTASLSTAPTGVNRIETYVGILSGSSSLSVEVLEQDPATASASPHPGFIVPQYVGTNSHIKIFRRADGLGPVDVRFNAYVEMLE